MRLWRTIFPGSEPIFSLSFFHFEPFFNNKKLDFGGIFLYISAKTRAQGPALSRHISAAVLIYDKSEPILKSRYSGL